MIDIHVRVSVPNDVNSNWRNYNHFILNCPTTT